MTLWPGTCIVHERFSERELVRLKARHPAAVVVAHPECPEAILALADHIGSTRSLLDFVLASPADEFIVATEPGIIHQMEKKAPHKHFIGAPGADGQCSCNNCPFMALNTLEKLYLCMVNMAPAIDLPEELRRAALKPLERMLALSPQAATSTTPQATTSATPPATVVREPIAVAGR